jgi:hypothetical protein
LPDTQTILMRHLPRLLLAFVAVVAVLFHVAPALAAPAPAEHSAAAPNATKAKAKVTAKAKPAKKHRAPKARESAKKKTVLVEKKNEKTTHKRTVARNRPAKH